MSGNRASRRAALQPAGTPLAQRYGARKQRRALAPGVVGALVLIGGAIALGTGWYFFVRITACVLALITAYFVVQARRWWVLPVPLVVAVLWNPLVPFAFAGQPFRAGHVVGAFALILTGLLAPYTDPD